MRAVVSHGEIHPLEPLPADCRTVSRSGSRRQMMAEVRLRGSTTISPSWQRFSLRMTATKKNNWSERCTKCTARPRSKFDGRWGSPDAGLLARLQPSLRGIAQGIAGRRPNASGSPGRPSIHFVPSHYL